MKYKYFTLFAIFISLFSLGCKENPEIPTESASNKYPLELNNEWNYEIVLNQKFYSEDGVDSTRTNKFHWGTKVINTNQQVDTLSNVIFVQDFSPEFPNTKNVNYYVNNNEKLFGLPEHNLLTFTLPKINSSKNNVSYQNLFSVQPNFSIANNENVDTTIYFGKVVLKYPLQIGKSWYELTNVDSTGLPKRKIEEKINVQTSAGNFECFKITRNPGLNITDYISLEYGLVKRIIKSDSLDISDGNKKQWLDQTNTITLTSVKIN